MRCERAGVGSCSAETTCNSIPSSVWDYYFKLDFNQPNYLRIPLATLAVNDPIQKTCTFEIMIVEDQVVLGAMLMQSLYINATSTDAVIQVVQHPMSGTYIGD